jgi:hypothetical protein
MIVSESEAVTIAISAFLIATIRDRDQTTTVQEMI